MVTAKANMKVISSLNPAYTNIRILLSDVNVKQMNSCQFYTASQHTSCGQHRIYIRIFICIYTVSYIHIYIYFSLIRQSKILWNRLFIIMPCLTYPRYVGHPWSRTGPHFGQECPSMWPGIFVCPSPHPPWTVHGWGRHKRSRTRRCCSSPPPTNKVNSSYVLYNMVIFSHITVTAQNVFVHISAVIHTVRWADNIQWKFKLWNISKITELFPLSSMF